jgi:hypothetical protein
MRRRLYFLVPDVEHCKAVVEEIKQNQISEQHIHVVANDDIPLEGMHRASKLQKSELGYGLEMGLGVGGIAGMLGGLLAVTFPPAGLALGGGALMIAASTLAGAGFGSIVSALIASDIPNHELEKFQTAVDFGQLLVIVDVPTPQVEDMISLIKLHHPEAEVGIASPNSSQAPQWAR